MAQVTTTHRIEDVNGHWPTAGELRQFLAGLPDDTVVTVDQQRGDDRHDRGAWALMANQVPKAAPAPSAVGVNLDEGDPPTPSWLAETGFTRGNQA